jgi:hypothetical protein
MPVTTSLDSNFCGSSLNYFKLKEKVPFYVDAISSAEKRLSPPDALYEACSHIPNACTMTPSELLIKINVHMKDLNWVITCVSIAIMDKSYFKELYQPIDQLVINMVKSNNLNKTRLDQAFDELKNSQDAEKVKHYADMKESGIEQFTYDIFALQSNRFAYSGLDYSKELSPRKIQMHICSNSGESNSHFDPNKLSELIDSIISDS